MNRTSKPALPAEAPVAERLKKTHRRPLRYVNARPRLIVSLAIFIVANAGLMALGLPLATAILLGFDLAAVVLLSILAHLFNKATIAHMRSQARAQDSGRWGFLWSGVVLSAVVLVALSGELQAASNGGVPALVVGVLSIVLSWLFLNTMFALHYAHGFYGDFGEKHEGLEFPGTQQPDYWDFAYFAIVIGMTFQVSDVQITSRYLRRVVLLHSVISFFFNVFIIAITVNIVAGQG
ncbi:MAG TPA: DUF1345 domain-containing protein [Rhodanobacter sp.]|nr:DUF1345 domain-containing protein [Rhodanobacter sp.]